ncbi:unnamed protein product [Schistosoma mattheei]|uniref:Uncharacterized protein n=1 Tax=Schistosoma mattheei TaxID=31246 RepID=A0A183Q006_9TREM|nr:unnamed protein product [Schistosoma mattheei]
MNEPTGVGPTFADACDDGTEIDTEQYDLSGFAAMGNEQGRKSNGEEDATLRVALSESEQLLTATRCKVIGHRVTAKDLIMLDERRVGDPPKFVGENWLN